VICDLLMYMCAINCRYRYSFDEDITKIKWCRSLPHMVDIGEKSSENKTTKRRTFDLSGSCQKKLNVDVR